MGRRFLTASGWLPLTLWVLTLESRYFSYPKSALGGWKPPPPPLTMSALFLGFLRVSVLGLNKPAR